MATKLWAYTGGRKSESLTSYRPSAPEVITNLGDTRLT